MNSATNAIGSGLSGRAGALRCAARKCGSLAAVCCGAAAFSSHRVGRGQFAAGHSPMVREAPTTRSKTACPMYSAPVMERSTRRRPDERDSGNQSVGYDQYDRFDLGYGEIRRCTAPRAGLKQTISAAHNAGMSYAVDLVWNHSGYSDQNTAGFYNAGGYPGFNIQLNPADNPKATATPTATITPHPILAIRTCGWPGWSTSTGKELADDSLAGECRRSEQHPRRQHRIQRPHREPA